MTVKQSFLRWAVLFLAQLGLISVTLPMTEELFSVGMALWYFLMTAPACAFPKVRAFKLCSRTFYLVLLGVIGGESLAPVVHHQEFGSALLVLITNVIVCAPALVMNALLFSPAPESISE